MNLFLFVLGRNPELSLAEIIAYFNREKIAFNLEHFNEKAVILKTNNNEAKKWAQELGGTIKIATLNEPLKELSDLELQLNYFEEFFYDCKTFSVNDYSSEAEEENVQSVKDVFKNYFKKNKFKIVYKLPKRFTLKGKFETAFLDLKRKNHVDINVIKINQLFYVGVTRAFKDPRGWIDRDVNRAVQEPILTTSPRLAQIMINLSQLRKGQVVLDPFCGIGTILQEALVSGLQVVGVELEPRRALATEKNLKKVAKNYGCTAPITVRVGDSRQVAQVIQQTVDGVVSEPYLGPYWRTKPNTASANEVIRELNGLYSAFFQSVGKRLSKGSKVVFILPEIECQNHQKVSVSKSVFESAGFKVESQTAIILGRKEFWPHVYRDTENRINRLIFVLEK